MIHFPSQQERSQSTAYQGLVSRKSRRLFGPEKPFVKLRPAHPPKLIFSYAVKGIKIKITAKFHVTEHLRFEDTKRIMSPEMFRDFRETGPRSTLVVSELCFGFTAFDWFNIAKLSHIVFEYPTGLSRALYLVTLRSVPHFMVDIFCD